MKVNQHKIAATLFFIFIYVAIGYSQITLKSIFETEWSGFSTDKMDAIQGGVLNMEQTLSNVLFDSATNTFTAVAKSSFTLDGSTYGASTKVSGTVDINTYKVVIRTDYVQYKDTLPNNWQWLFNEINLTIFSNSQKDGHYILSGGTFDSSQSLISEFQYLN